MHKRLRFSLGILFVAFFLAGIIPASAQGPTLDSVQINHLDDTQPVRVTQHISVLQKGQAVQGLPAQAFSVFVDGEQITTGVDVQAAAPGLAVAVLVDISGSMDEPGILNERRLLDARQLAGEFVKGLREEDWVALIGFGSELTPVENLTYDHGLVLNTIQQLPALAGPRDADRRGFTHLFDAVVEAVDMLTNNEIQSVREQTAALRKVVVVFSDGNDTGSTASRPEAQRVANEKRVSVYAVNLCSRPGQGDNRFTCQSDDVNWLASRTNGELLSLRQASDQDAIGALYARLESQRNQYRVAYEWHEARGLHKCRVEVRSGETVQVDEMECTSKLLIPQIRITSPAAETFYSRAEAGPVNLAVALDFPDGTPRNPSKIEYFVNGGLVHTEDNPAWDALPVFTWNTADLSGDDYTLLAVVHDPWTQNQNGSERIKVSLEDWKNPQITLTATVTEVQTVDNAVITFTVNAAFPDNVPRELILSLRDEGRGAIAEARGFAPFLIRWPVGNAAHGQHLVMVEIQDSKTGRQVRSNEVIIDVRPTFWQQVWMWLLANWYWLLLSIIFLIVVIILWRRKPAILTPVTTGIKALTTRLSSTPSWGRLVVISGPQRGDYPLRDQISILGRDGDVSNVVIQGDPAISGKHATIQKDPAGVFLRDDGSANGTFLNNRQVLPQSGWAQIRDGDVITLGQTRLQFHELGKTTRRLP